MRKVDIVSTLYRKRWWLLTLCLPSMLCGATNTLPTELPAGVDVSRWICSYCAFEQGYSGEIEMGPGFVSRDSFKFGEYSGLKDKGFFLVGNAMAQYRDDKADYLDLSVRDLGIDSRSIDIEGGRQGRYQWFLGYHEIPHYIADKVKTPYRGNGSDRLQLPSGWTSAGSTAGMTGLATNLQDETLKTKRERLSVGASFIPSGHWQTAIEFHHEVRDGQIGTAGSFFFNSAQLIAPVDYVTNEAQVSVSYVTRLWQFRAGYYGSYFSNHDPSLTWQNAYNPLVAGAVRGQLALPPSNLFHQLLLSSAYQISQRSRINGDIAIGRMEQNEALIAATTNPALAVALPETSANARIDTLTANLKLNSKVTSRLRLNAAYRYNDHDNKTPSLFFNWVTNDSFINIARRNLPYSFTDQNLRLDADYRLDQTMRFSAGYSRAKKDRTHQEVDHTTEDIFWGKVNAHSRNNINLDIKVAQGQRDASGYHMVNETVPPQNPLMRKYNMADRSRDSSSVSLGINSIDWIGVEFSVDVSHDLYSHSTLGLTASRDLCYNADVSLNLVEKTSLHVFAGREHIASQQDGSQSFTAADWFAQNDDTVDSLGAGLKRSILRGKMTVGGDYLLSHSIGKTSIDSGAVGGDFPDLKSDLITITLYADYRLAENLTLHGAYWYGNYHVTDWQLNGINTTTIANVIGLGDVNTDYDVRAMIVTLRYRF